MKCPKCGYLGLDSGDRCKNCGYEFALVARDDTPIVVDDPRLARGAKYRRTPVPADRAPNQPAVLERRLTPMAEGTPIDLPLFGDGSARPPRPPISVRRPTPTPVRLRPRQTPSPTPVELTLNLEAAVPVAASAAAPVRPSPPEASASQAPAVEMPAAVAARLDVPAPTGRRCVAAALDIALVAAIDAAVLWFTLRLCGLTPAEWRVLPPVPLAAFFAVFNGGYVMLFTGVLGKTLGKMAVGIEVVPVGEGTMDLKRAAIRVAGTALSVAPACLGLLPAAFGMARPLHDWMAGTQVVRSTA